MKVLGLFEINRIKANPPKLTTPTGTLLPPYSGYSGWWNVVRESFPGAWQRNVEIRLENVLTFSTVYACITLIAGDIGKIGLHLVEQDDDGIWNEVENPAFSPVLRKPNHYQTRQRFIENWVSSKLVHGNTFVLKERDSRNVVTQLYVLDPQITRVLVAPDSSLFYQLGYNQLAGVDEGLIGVDMTEIAPGMIVVPASEIIHDVMVPLYHPLCGVSPISACGLAAMQGLAIQNESAKFFTNGSRPGGVLTAPGAISDETAKRIKDYWEVNFTGQNAGKVAVLGDGLAYEPMSVNPHDAQLINQLKWTSENVCSAFHVPPYMVSVGPMPSYSNIESINLQYYSQCLQPIMEGIEALLDDGLGLVGANQQYGTEFCLDDLLKMDTNTQYRTYGEGVSKGILSPNEARQKVGLAPVVGGDTPYLQQQNYSLAALNKRDTKADPFAGPKPPALPKPPNAQPADQPPAMQANEWHAALKREFDHARIR